MSGGPGDHFKRLRSVYRAAFNHPNSEKLSPAGKEILVNLKQMSSYGSSPFRSDPVAMAYQVGMQDVVRHMLHMLNISDEEIYRINQMAQSIEGSFSDD